MLAIVHPVDACPGLSVATVKNYWTFARTWLFHEIKNS